MNKLAMELVRLCRQNRDGSFATQSNRRRGLSAIATDLQNLGYKMPKTHSLKPKHVQAIITHWKDAGLSEGTIKNRMGWVRWWAQKINKESIIPRNNDDLGIARRQTNISNKAWQLEEKCTLPDQHMNLSLALIAAFGLRIEEALKLKPIQADLGHVLKLQASWTKGGREREIPIRTDDQRKLLAQAKKLVGNGSLIPADKSYIAHRKSFDHQTLKHGLTNLHGLRHRYAQTRYAELTSRTCPKAGGRKFAQLSQREKLLDRQARLIVSAELGHNRIAITKIYLG